MSAKVVSIFSASRAVSKETKSMLEKNDDVSDFQAIEQRNTELREKLRKEREQANKGVLKSYKIK